MAPDPVDSPDPGSGCPEGAPAVVTIETPGLGDRSYLAHDGNLAVVFDPQRDIDRVEGAARAAGVRITHVFETHIHNDYVTGGLALSRAAGAAYVVSSAEKVDFERIGAADGDCFRTGRLAVVAVATPGHTESHLSFTLALDDHPPAAVFTGGSMLYGAVGRTDLAGPHLTERLTRAQYRSVRRLAAELPDETEVFPTHGFGSFCSATPTTGASATIGDQRRENLALVTGDEEAFLQTIVGGLSSYPRYYAHMAAANLAGPGAADLDPPRPVEPGELRRRIEKGEWVVDVRARRAFARSHVSGTISVDLAGSFATYLGWTIPWGMPLTLVGDTAEQVAAAQRELVRIGIDELAGAGTGGPEALSGGATSSFPAVSFADLKGALAAGRVPVLLDVRRPDEWEAGHIATARHIPLWELESRAGEVAGEEVWVHCASGFRASIAASLLERAGRKVVAVDDDWGRALAVGLA